MVFNHRGGSGFYIILELLVYTLTICNVSYQSNSADCVNNLADVNFMPIIISHNFHWNRNLFSNYVDTK